MAGNSYGGYVGGSYGDFPENSRVPLTACYENGVTRREKPAPDRTFSRPLISTNHWQRYLRTKLLTAVIGFWERPTLPSFP